MSVLTYSNLALDWSPDHRQDSFFKRLSIIILVVVVLLAVVIQSIPVPEEKRRARTVVPERVAKFIMQQKKPKVVKAKPKPKPKPPLKVVKKIRKDIKSKKPLTKKQQAARKKVENSGLLALGKELSDLMDTSDVSSMVGKRVSKNAASKQIASVNKSLLTSNVAKGSGGVSRDKYSTRVGKTVLSAAEKVAFRESLSSNGKLKGKDHRKQRRGENVRSEEDVIYVMDQNKSKLHAIYRRARRSHPGLKGKIVLEITIAPSGKVLKVIIKSSELNDSKLESRLIARIKRFDFGSRSVEPVTVTFPIEFLPS